MPDKFTVAKQLHAAAFALDTSKADWPDVDIAECINLAERMYRMAEKLAGDRRLELYGPQEQEGAQ